MDYERMPSPWGRDCYNCPVFIASGNEKLKKAMAHRLRIPEYSLDFKRYRDEEGKCKFLGALGRIPRRTVEYDGGILPCYEPS